MAIADASYFDWAVLPEVPGGLIAQPTGGGVDLKWQETEGCQQDHRRDSFRTLKSMGRGGPRAGKCHQLSSKRPTAGEPHFIPHLCREPGRQVRLFESRRCWGRPMKAIGKPMAI